MFFEGSSQILSCSDYFRVTLKSVKISPVKRRLFSTELKLISSNGFMDIIEISVPRKESSTLIINRFSVRSKKNKNSRLKEIFKITF